ncbi:cell surface glycoprotein CD200 receptor 5-like isoform X2 [Scleropages formosus]|uniref:cell surface glycoprotein CD200 receptor 5-like isoform X2 n=1 Tax=Scleropages formosus TaxID=113540 RepID=UPI000878E812|nr:cell surface glycoprotein CD200 receptor 5-like isoform X2 [Scleropages formosus]
MVLIQPDPPSVRHWSPEQFFALDSTVNIPCYNEPRKQIIYNIWNLKMKANNCCIAWHFNESQIDTCKDGKVLRNGTSGQPFLYIPRFTREDEGIYFCETAYLGGCHTAKIQVSAKIRPEISGKLVLHHDRKVAVCSAAGGKPAATISWSTIENVSDHHTATPNLDGTFTVERRLVLSNNVSHSNLTCIVTHPSLGEAHMEKILPSEDAVPWKWIGVSLASTGLIAFMLTGFFLARKHFSNFSTLLQRCCKFHNQLPAESQKKQDGEEMELCSSYVQRVNSIYKSSADLCNY